MATQEIIAIGTDEVASPDLTLAEGETCNLGIKLTDGAAMSKDARAGADILRKDDAGAYNPTNLALHPYNLNMVLTGQGTYQIKRRADASVAFGVYGDGGTLAEGV